LLFLLVLTFAGCGADDGAADMSLPACPPLAGNAHGARCTPGVDTLCVCGPDCYTAHCQCDGWWETDAIEVCCDADGGTARCP
jgi:hypothetical protein